MNVKFIKCIIPHIHPSKILLSCREVLIHLLFIFQLFSFERTQNQKFGVDLMITSSLVQKSQISLKIPKKFTNLITFTEECHFRIFVASSQNIAQGYILKSFILSYIIVCVTKTKQNKITLLEITMGCLTQKTF